MMDKEQVGFLLLFASGLDRFVDVNDVTTDAWLRVLSDYDVTYEQAEKACIDHYTGPDGSRPFTVAHVVAQITANDRTATAAIAADVRSAKARGLIAKSWPERDRLPDGPRAELFRLRELERGAAAERWAIEQGATS